MRPMPGRSAVGCGTTTAGAAGAATTAGGCCGTTTTGVGAGVALAGLAVNSLAAAVFALVGALVGVVTAHALGAESDLVTAGLLGFNPVLTAIAFGAVFYRPGPRVVAYTLLATVLSVIVQGAVVAALTPFGIPTLTAAFVLVSWLFLLPRQQFE
jgi:urea transporter